jgi:hypothetical protein
MPQVRIPPGQLAQSSMPVTDRQPTASPALSLSTVDLPLWARESSEVRIHTFILVALFLLLFLLASVTRSRGFSLHNAVLFASLCER